jgi:CRP/FNR family transcriptional regulator, dissimilatory nitrate respiration regulator
LTCIKPQTQSGPRFDVGQHGRRTGWQAVAMQQGLRLSPTSLAAARDRKLLERVVGALPPFRELPQPELSGLLAHCRVLEARRGEVFVRRGERMPGIIALASGSAKVSLRGEHGEEKVLRLLGPGDSFGFAATALDQPSPVDVVALASATVAVVPPLPVQQLLQTDGRFALAMTRELARRMLELVAELEASVQHSGLQRLAGYLGTLAASNGGSPVHLPATKTTIAARLGVKKETLSRMLRELAGRRLIEVSGPEVAILDLDALSRVAGAPARSGPGPAP